MAAGQDLAVELDHHQLGPVAEMLQGRLQAQTARARALLAIEPHKNWSLGWIGLGWVDLDWVFLGWVYLGWICHG
jgi:hypothetical protein